MIAIRDGAPEASRGAIARLLGDAFGGKLAAIHGPAPMPGFAIGLDLGRCLVAMRGSAVVGVAGYALDSRRLMPTPGAWALLRARGPAGLAGWAAARLLNRPERPEVLLMDGIAVDAASRGRGIGTELLRAVRDLAARSGRPWLRLDVLDGNPGALRLYLRLGFAPVRVLRLGALGRRLLGCSAVTTLVQPATPNTCGSARHPAA